MSRAHRLGLAAVIVAVTFEAHAWGPGTHLYLARKICGTSAPDVLYGAMAPDFCSVVFTNPTASSKLQHMTHYEFGRLEPSLFRTGFATHNGDWGADHYAHLYYDTGAPDIYSTIKIRQLSTEFGISMQQAEALFEGTVDFLLRLDLGVEFAHSILLASTGSDHAEELVAVYAEELAVRASLPLGEAEEMVRTAAVSFRMLTEVYGQQLLMDEPEMRAMIPGLLASYMGVDVATAETCFLRCEELCQDDYLDELDRVAELVRVELEAREGYELPAGPWMAPGLAAALLLLGAWAVLSARPRPCPRGGRW